MIENQSNIQQEAPPVAKPKRQRGNALKALRRSAARIVLQNSDKIAEALLSETLTGDSQTGKLLIALSEKPPSGKRKKKKRSLALEWTNEPEWNPAEDPETKSAELDGWGLPIRP